MKIEKGNRVKVEFISESATQFSGGEIRGFGVVDRCEDGYVFGRLENGKPFMCLESDCELVINPSLDFEQWFIDQDFYTNMRFIHGDNLFSKDGDVYRVLPVQMACVAYQEKAHFEEMNNRYLGKMQEQQDQIAELKECIANAELQIAVHWGADEDTDSVLRDIEKALRGDSCG